MIEAIVTIAPILVVDAVEPCLPFWTERLGFVATTTVPHGDALGFAMLERDGVTVMYQSRASVDDDIGEAAPDAKGLGGTLAGSTTTLFVTVPDLDPVMEAMEGVKVVVPRRQTFYGMDELFVRAPCGTLVGFAARIDGNGEGE